MMTLSKPKIQSMYSCEKTPKNIASIREYETSLMDAKLIQPFSFVRILTAEE